MSCACAYVCVCVCAKKWEGEEQWVLSLLQAMALPSLETILLGGGT